MLRGKKDLGLYNQFENNWPLHRINENTSMISAAGVMVASAALAADDLGAAEPVTQLAVTYRRHQTQAAKTSCELFLRCEVTALLH
jgi:hypothetical protein